jgi:hypothetical protein
LGLIFLASIFQNLCYSYLAVAVADHWSSFVYIRCAPVTKLSSEPAWTTISLKFRFVFWVVLPCKITVDRSLRGGSSYLWNVCRQLFYTAVYPRRQIWTSYSPPWELEIWHRQLACSLHCHPQDLLSLFANTS